MSIVVRLLESIGLMLIRQEMGMESLPSSLGPRSPKENRKEFNIPKHAITLVWASGHLPSNFVPKNNSSIYGSEHAVWQVLSDLIFTLERPVYFRTR